MSRLLTMHVGGGVGGGGGAAAPEMAVFGNGQAIASGDETPSLADHTDFGDVEEGQTRDRTFTIANLGDAALHLTGAPRVTLTGAAAFTVTVQPAATVDASDSTTFTIRFAPTAAGSHAATAAIANDDADENPYLFAIGGTGVEAPLPEDWYDAAWAYRKKITVPADAVAGSDTMALPLFFAPDEDADILAKARPDGFDLTFTRADGVTPVPHELIPSQQFGTRNGGRTWFGGPRLLYHDGTDEKLFFSYQSVGGGGTGKGYVGAYDYATHSVTLTQVSASDTNDDHVAPGLLLRSADSRLLATFPEQHNGSGDLVIRISTHPEDATAWQTAQVLDPNANSNYSYPSPIELAGAGKIYVVYRSTDRWWFIASTDDGATWSSATPLTTDNGVNGWGSRPYLVWCSNDDDRMDFLFSQSAPAEAGNKRNVYHCYYDGTWRLSDGAPIGHAPPFTGNELTLVFQADAGDAVWVGAIAYDANDRPHAFFYVYPGDSVTDHDLYYAAFDGSDWSTHKVTDEGDGFATMAQAYPGVAVLDPDDATVAWVAREESGVYELQKWRKSGGTWAKEEDVTQGSTHHHLRPVVAKGCPLGKKGRISFVAPRTYDLYTDWTGGIGFYPVLGSHFHACYFLGDVDGGNDTDFYVYYGNPNAADQQDPQAVWADYVRVYHTTEHFGAAPGFYRDSSGHGANLSYYKLTEGEEPVAHLGRSVALNGSTDYLDLGSPDFASATQVTTEIWAKTPLSGSDEHTLYGHADGQNRAQWLHRLETPGGGGAAVEWFFNGLGDVFQGGTVGGLTPTANVWQYHVAAWSAAGGAGIRINKTQGTISLTPVDSLDATSSTALHAGQRADFVDVLTGNLAELRVSVTKALAKDQTDSQYDNWDQGNAFFVIGMEETP